MTLHTGVRPTHDGSLPLKWLGVAATALLVAILGWGLARLPAARTAPTAAAEPLRAVRGAFSAYRDASGKYEPVTAPCDLASGTQLMTGVDAHNAIRLPDGGWLRLAARTAGAVQAVERRDGVAHVELRVDDGRWYGVAGASEEVVARSFNCEVTARDAECEVVVYQDRDHFLNTVVRCWQGILHVRGGPGLKQAADLRYGETLTTDDAAMHPTTSFDATAPDAWQAWNRAARTADGR